MIYAYAILAGVCSISQIVVGTYIAVAYRDSERCTTFFLRSGDNNNNSDRCLEMWWAGNAWFCGALWGMISICTFCFVKRGRHALYEGKYGSTDATATNVLELRTTVAEVVAEPIANDDYDAAFFPTATLSPDP
eukprot:CAMPEP_0116143004 /NCGR_PEP_ID=MMETSP0329-20121206/15215_1 /TAXON_ID=697910 /ORGANISM="Pseudo-nitzschia arenysensis, Strain B593" /LENGTH=133 /DNA_ID=CAMNT_0003638287 /DNA_START=219 /DNA_END=620 /DNA_ORIENTATION=+